MRVSRRRDTIRRTQNTKVPTENVRARDRTRAREHARVSVYVRVCVCIYFGKVAAVRAGERGLCSSTWCTGDCRRGRALSSSLSKSFNSNCIVYVYTESNGAAELRVRERVRVFIAHRIIQTNLPTQTSSNI